MPGLSVLLPVRDGAATIERAVRSTLQAMPRDAELVVLDDASTDSTGERLASVVDRRLRIETSPAPRGVAGGLNHLLAITDSEVVARMDGDDVSSPLRFRRQLPALATADVVFSTVVQWRPARGLRGVTPPKPTPISPRAFPLQLVLRNPVSHPTMTARRDVIDAAGGYREVPAEDYDLWIRLALAGVRLRRLALPDLVYRLHPHQVTASTIWRDASWSDPQVLDAYGQLCGAVLGTRFPRLLTLAAGPGSDAEMEAVLAAFGAAVARAADRLPANERRAALHKLHEKVGATRQVRASRRLVAG